MTEILIFKQPEVGSNNPIPSNIENELMYKKFEKNNILGSHHFPSFFDMINIKKKDLYINSGIPSILINNIIKFTCPIVNNISSHDFIIKSINIFKKKIDNKKHKESKNKKVYSFNTKFNMNVACVCGNKKYIIPGNTDISVIGIKICKNLFKNISNTSFDYFLTLMPNDLLISGNYSVIYTIHNIYLQQLYKKYRININNINIYFLSDADAIYKINKIYSYIQYINNLYVNNFDILLNYLKSQYTLLNKNILKSKIKNNDNKHQVQKTLDILNIDNNVLMLFNKFKNIPNFIKKNAYNIEFILYKYNILDTIYKINTIGINHQYSKKTLSRIKDNKKKDNKKKIIELSIINAIKKNIKFNKFGNISLLSEFQEKIIEQEYGNLVNIKTNIKKNKEIIDYYKKLENDNIEYINTNNIKNLKLNIKEIEKVLNISIKCKKELMLENPLNIQNTKYLQDNKKINVICPHRLSNAYQLIKLTDSSKQSYIKIYGEIRTNLINIFSLPLIEDGYFCKICGSKIADSDNDDAIHFISGKRVSFVTENDFIKDIIWKEVSYLVSRYILFKNKVNLKKIINNIVETMREKIGNIYVDISKNKIISSESLNNLLKLHINIYATAILIQMIYINYGNITFTIRSGKKNTNTESNYIEIQNAGKNTNSKRGGKKDPKQIILKNIINNGLYLIMKVKYILISTLNNISKDYIKNTLLSAYKWILNISVEKDIRLIPDSNEFIIDKIKNSKLYKYLSYVKELNIKKNTNNEIEKIRKDMSSNNTISKLPIFTKYIDDINNIKIKDILGITISDITDKKNTDSIYEQSILSKKPNDMPDYKYESLSLLMKYIKKKLYMLNAVPYNNKLKEFNDDFTKLREIENKIHYDMKFNELYPLNTLLFKNLSSYNNFYNKDIILEKYYDNNGNLHIFDIYVYQPINNKGIISGKKIEYTLNDIINIYKNTDTPNGLKLFNAFINLVLIDQRCSTCKNYKSLSNSSNKNKNIHINININSKIKNFYSYYKYICPIEGLHNYNKTRICSKCGMNDLNKSDIFYNKHKNKYKISKSKKNQSIISFIGKKEIKKSYLKNQPKEIKKKEWKYNTENIKKINNLFNINYNIWSNLGASYKYNFSIIEKKKCNPINDIKSENDIRFRCAVVKSYIKNMPIIINKIMNYTIITNIPYNLKKILNKSNITDLNNKINIKQFNKNFNNLYDYYYATEKSINLYNYLLDTLSLYILDLYNTLNTNKINVSRDIILYIINNIISVEKSFSVLNINDYKIISNKLDDLVDSDIIENNDENIEDMNDENIDNSDDEFARNNIDMENEDIDDDTNLIADF